MKEMDRVACSVFYRSALASTTEKKLPSMGQYLCQLGKAEGRLRGMNTAQAGDLVENLGK